MSRKFSVGEEVKAFVSEILAKNDFDAQSIVEYKPGPKGDTGVSQAILVDIRDKEKSLRLFLKCSTDIPTIDANIPFLTEILFYEVIHPAFVKFQKKHNVEDVFRNVPKFYGAATGSPKMIALEDLTSKGYQSLDKLEFYSEEHLKLSLVALAKFHAISYAFSQQEDEAFAHLGVKLNDYFIQTAESQNAINRAVQTGLLNEFVSRLHPKDDGEVLIYYLATNAAMNDVRYEPFLLEKGIIRKSGDVNARMLFRNEAGKPNDVMLVDWQMVAVSAPIVDIYKLIYPTATQEILDNLEVYLKTYYEELSARLREVKVNPEQLYPYGAFLYEWDYAAYVAFADLMGTFERRLLAAVGTPYYHDMKEEYVRRLTLVGRHLVRQHKIFAEKIAKSRKRCCEIL